MKGPSRSKPASSGTLSASSEDFSIDVSIWQHTQNRVSLYVTTNGIIEISLCGLYATAAAALVAFGKTQADSQLKLTFGLIIPIFSTVILALAANVYAWIRCQLQYISTTAPHPRHHLQFVSYEEWKGLMRQSWLRKSRRKRLWLRVWHAVKLYGSLPFNVNNIYRYYFMIYVATAIASLAYAVSRGVHGFFLPLLVMVQIFLLSTGTQEVVILESEHSSVGAALCAYPGLRLEDLGDDF